MILLFGITSSHDVFAHLLSSSKDDTLEDIFQRKCLAVIDFEVTCFIKHVNVKASAKLVM